MFRWLAGRGASKRQVERQLAEIADDDWRTAWNDLHFLRGLTAEDNEALRLRAAWLLASKSFSGAGGLELTDRIMLSIASQAALPILNLDPALYEGWTEIIVYPGGFLIPRADTDDSGVVHEYIMEASGEAWDGGPVILSWEPMMAGVDDTNVVIHEFAHKLDLYSGDADGIPSLHAHPELTPRDWRRVLKESYERFCTALDSLEAAIPSDIDPESHEADPWYGRLPLDPYAATDEAEFFAVSSETFFVSPHRLQRGLPDWYALLARYYRQDPLGRLGDTIADPITQAR